MPAKDLYHDAVKNALINDGWIITADPYIIKYEDAELYADLSAEKPIAAERQDQKIVVEIKSFVGKSMMYDFHNALGQYIVYRNLIQLTEPEYIIYLAIDQSSVHRLAKAVPAMTAFRSQFIKHFFSAYQCKQLSIKTKSC